ncbi:Amidohydrolase 1 [Moelleriella libera RCEF 2490]|uniref:Amidohydrolase 1 n=1 Tax=Moelleriella libera RCEF 2490 TaxID=1081109 RepID=A0A162IS71_9HYPO|nr:Amidohydrolase 1 [Moelleriella libera RCEF 2490]
MASASTSRGVPGPSSILNESLDGRGCTVMSGLIDSSVDVGFASQVFAHSEKYGVTTIIDSTSSESEYRAIKHFMEDDPTLPSYFTSGSAIASDNDGLNHLLNYRTVAKVSTPAEAVNAVYTKISLNKARFIKVIIDQPGLTLEVMSAAVKEAHRHGKLAIGHATQTESYQLGVDAGFDVLTPVPVNGSIDDDLAKTIGSKGIGIIPTLAFLEKAVPQWTAHGIQSDFAFAVEAVKKLNAAKAPICAGSGANTSAALAIPFGQGLHEELRALARAGLSNSDVLKAATTEPTKIFGLAGRGVVEVGQPADMIMVEGNPLDDLDVMSRIRHVWVRGLRVSQYAEDR